MLHIVAAQVIGTDGQGILRLEQEMLRAVLPHKSLDGVGIQQHNILQGVAGDKAILTDHHRQTDGGVLSDGHGLEEIVIGLLVVLRVNLNPPRVPDAHGVRVVVVDVDGAGEGPVYAGQGDGKPAGGRHVHHLIHQGQAR